MNTDTIAAIATALSDAGIGIVRVSGPDAVTIVDKCFYCAGGENILASCKSHTIHYGYIKNQEQEIIDEVLVSLMREPRSYTGENTVEINCHGGVLLLKRVLETVLKSGARLAEPGEFTKRAFLNGKMDLSRAEAVMDLIHSENDFALRSSVKQLRGCVANKIKELRQIILYEIAFIESALDDPEHISMEGYPLRLSEKTDYLIKEIKTLLRSADNGRMLKEGIKTVILGKPNAGKSSLLNWLLGEERAIVTDIAGTTRDALEESVRLREIGLHIVDTAGIRSTDDLIEQIGVKRAKEQALQADLILYVADSSLALDESDFEILNLVREKKTIIILNKIDLPTIISQKNFQTIIGEDWKNFRFVSVSTKENLGLKELEDELEDLFFQGDLRSDQEVVITNLRHKEALEESLQSLGMVKESLELGMPEDFYSIDLMAAYASLGKILGEEVGEDLVNEIFSRFCMGK